MIDDWIKLYGIKSEDDLKFALREIMQEIALAGLYRANFFKKAVFYGGTALRIFYGLPRFSEDMDFSLTASDPSFKMDVFLKPVLVEFQAAGLDVVIKTKTKMKESNIESVWLTADLYWKSLIKPDIFHVNLSDRPIHIGIKIETDTMPPLGFTTQEHLLLRPFSCYIRCFSPTDLFASKMHALLFRKWKNRVKGRDWFDLEWYIKNGFELNLSHFYQRAIQSKDLDAGKLMSSETFNKLLRKKIQSVSFSRIKDDVIRFIPDAKALDAWSENYFLDLMKHLKCKR